MEEAEANKLFVARIVWETTDDILKEHFAKYGDVVNSVIVKDHNSEKHRGYAFVTFSESSAVDRALQDSHEILGRKVDVKRAIRRKEQTQHHHSSSICRTKDRSNNQLETKKIFVGGLSADLTEEEFKHYFERFGIITDFVVMRDNITHRPRGFGFVTFDSEDSVEEVLQKKYHELHGKLVEVKMAVPRDETTSSINGHGGIWDSLTSFHPFSSRFMYFSSVFDNIPWFPIPYGNGLYGGGYPIGGSLASVPLRSHWGLSMDQIWGNYMPYGSVDPMNSAYFNSGLGMMDFIENGYSGDIQNAAESSPS